MAEIAEKTVVIVNELGMHARAATRFVQLASKFDSEVYVTKDEQEVNGKSIMGVLMLVASKGSRIHLRAEGSDAAECIEGLAALVAAGFDE